MRLTLKTINDELRRLGHDVHVDKGTGMERAGSEGAETVAMSIDVRSSAVLPPSARPV